MSTGHNWDHKPEFDLKFCLRCGAPAQTVLGELHPRAEMPCPGPDGHPNCAPRKETPEILALAGELAQDPTNYPRWVKPGVYYLSLESRIAAALSSQRQKD